MEFVVGIFVSIAIGLFLMEVSDRKNQIVSWLVALAVRLLPVDKNKRLRYREEWESDALASPGRISAIMRALGSIGAAGVMMAGEKVHTLKSNTKNNKSLLLSKHVFFTSKMSQITELHTERQKIVTEHAKFLAEMEKASLDTEKKQRKEWLEREAKWDQRAELRRKRVKKLRNDKDFFNTH